MSPLRQFFISTGAKDLYNNTVNNLVGQGINMAFSNYYAQKQLQYQKELNQDAFDKQVEFWNMQNKYNTPSAQMSRYIDAGFNPALMNQGTMNNQAGGLSSVPSGQANVPVPNQSNSPIDSILTRAGQLKQMGLVDKQTEEYVQKIAGIILDNDIKEIAKAMNWSEAQLEELKRTSFWEATFGNLDKFVDNPYLDGDTSQLGEMLINVFKTDEDVRRAEEERIKSEANYTNALATTEDALRELRVEEVNKRIEVAKAEYFKLSADAKRALAESKSIEQLNARREVVDAASTFYGFQIHDLPPTLQTTLLTYYSNVVKGEFTPSEAYIYAKDMILNYRKKELHIPETWSESYSTSESGSLGGFSVKGEKSNSRSSSWSHTK